jgi:hypothetical protein
MISGVHASHRKGRELAGAEREECTSPSACSAVARIVHRSDDLVGTIELQDTVPNWSSTPAIRRHRLC